MSDPVEPRVLDARYVLEAPLGQGSMGTVWRARQISLDREVAVKLIDHARAASPELRARFEREARLLSRLRHPSIVSVIDFGISEGQPFLVMELIEGRSLEAVLSERGALGVDAARAVMLGLARALGHAHAQGILHRDLKPSNVIVERDSIKLLDFGIARAMTDAGAELTQEGMIVGTPSYVSPEQIAGGPLDARADLYALGVLGFRMLRGELPFRAESLVALLHQHVSTPPLALEPLFAEPEARRLARLVDALLEKDPARRPPSAEAVVLALEPPPSPAIEPAAPGASSAPRTPNRRALLVGGLALLVVGGYALARLPRQPEPGVTPPSVQVAGLEAELRRRVEREPPDQLLLVLEERVERSPRDAALRVLLARVYARAERAAEAVDNLAWVARNAPDAIDDEGLAALRALAAHADPRVQLPAVAIQARIGARDRLARDAVAVLSAALAATACRDRLAAVTAIRTLPERALRSALIALAGRTGECGAEEAQQLERQLSNEERAR